MDFSILKDNQLKPVHYLVKHEEIKYNQKNDCHPILADYGDDQFSRRNNNKREDIHIKPLQSFSIKSIFHFESKYCEFIPAFMRLSSRSKMKSVSSTRAHFHYFRLVQFPLQG